MKKLLVKSLLIAAIITTAGTAVNLITFCLLGQPLLSTMLSGGEWTGYLGFGILMNKTFPMTASPNADFSGRTWLEFVPGNYILTLAIIWLVVVLVFFAFNQIRKGKLLFWKEE